MPKRMNLRQIEEEFSKLDERERRNGTVYDETRNIQPMIMLAGSSNQRKASYWDPVFDASSPNVQPPIRQVPNTLTHYRSPLHIKQETLKKKETSIPRNAPATSQQLSEDNTIDPSQEIMIRDDDSYVSDEIADEVTPISKSEIKVASVPVVDSKLADIFAFEIKVHHTMREHSDGLFDVKIYDSDKPFENLLMLKDLRMNRDCCIVFYEPNIVKFNALTLEWVDKPETLLNHTLIVEVQGTFPSRTRVARSSIRFSHNKKYPLPNTEKKHNNTSPKSISPTKVPRIHNFESSLPYSTTLPREKDLTVGMNNIPVTTTKTVQEPEEDAIQRKLERVTSGSLSPNSERLRELHQMRENMKLNLMVQQKLISPNNY